MSTFIRLILRHRMLVGLLILCSVGAAGFSARSIAIRFQYRDFFDYPANPRLPVFRKDSDEFGDPGGYVVALIEADEVFSRPVLDYVRTLTTALEPDPTFVRVRSLSNVDVVRGKADEIVTGPLISSASSTPDNARALSAAEDTRELAEIKQFALHSPLLLRRLVSVDAKATAVLAEMRTPATFATVAEQGRALDAVKKVLDAHPAPPGVQVRVTGAPAVEVGVTQSLIKDQLVLMPAVMSVLVVMLFLTFRSVHGIVLAMSAVSVATIWTAGVFALFGRPVDIVGSVIPTTILVYGIVDPIFVLTRVLRKLETGLDKETAIVQAFTELALPCFLTSLTTSLGFAAFVTARAPTIRAYGLTVGLGVLLAWVTTVTVLPVLLAAVPAPKHRFATLSWVRVIDAALTATWKFLDARLVPTVLVTALVLVGGGVLAMHQHIDNGYVDGLPRGEERANVRRLEATLMGVLRLVVHLEGPKDAMKRPEVLEAIEGVGVAIRKERLVTFTTSISDLVSEANQAFAGGDPDAHHVPKSRSLVAQYLAMVDPADRADVVNEEYSRSHIAILLKDEGSEATEALEARLQKVLQNSSLGSYGITASLTGNAVAAYRELDDVVTELLYGFVNAFVIIVALQWLMLRSVRLALVSVVPNLLPVIACFLILRFAKIPLQIDNALVMCIAIGGLFNTTIHFSARVQQRVREGEFDPSGVVLHSMRATIPSALFTAATLSTGFSVLLLSSFPGLRDLGLLSMVTLMIGFFSDMIVTAVLIRLGYDWKRQTERASAKLASAQVRSVEPVS